MWRKRELIKQQEFVFINLCCGRSIFGFDSKSWSVRELKLLVSTSCFLKVYFKRFPLNLMFSYHDSH